MTRQTFDLRYAIRFTSRDIGPVQRMLINESAYRALETLNMDDPLAHVYAKFIMARETFNYATRRETA